MVVLAQLRTLAEATEEEAVAHAYGHDRLNLKEACRVQLAKREGIQHEQVQRRRAPEPKADADAI